MSRQKAQINTPVHPGGAFSRNENSSLWHFTPRKKIALQLAVLLWIAGGLLGAPGIAAAEDITIRSETDMNSLSHDSSDLPSPFNGKTVYYFNGEHNKHNSVNIDYATSPSNIIFAAGYSNDGEVKIQDLYVSEAASADLIGGMVTGRGSASFNQVIIRTSASTPSGNIYGGYSFAGCAYNNTVNIHSPLASQSIQSISQSIYGGYGGILASNNTVNLADQIDTSGNPSVKGGSGMFELGWQVKPDASPLTLDLGLTAWAGKQRGLTGQLGMNWKF